LAIQLIINREWGLAKSENPHQGSFIIEELTDAVEEAVLQELFARLMDAVRVCSLGQITETLIDVGGQHRRNM
jgi:methylmalonyl-CoA mutase N-terminal domain/subunit